MKGLRAGDPFLVSHLLDMLSTLRSRDSSREANSSLQGKITGHASNMGPPHFAPSSFLLLVVMPGALVASLLLVAMPFVPSSVLAACS